MKGCGTFQVAKAERLVRAAERAFADLQAANDRRRKRRFPLFADEPFIMDGTAYFVADDGRVFREDAPNRTLFIVGK